MRRNEGVGCDLLTYRDARGHENATEEYEYACETPAFKDLADCLECAEDASDASVCMSRFENRPGGGPGLS